MIELWRGGVIPVVDKCNDFTGKPRPMPIVQRTSTLDVAHGLMVCMITKGVTDTLPMRDVFMPTEANGLETIPMPMIDKIGTIKRSRLRTVVGHMGTSEMDRVDAALCHWRDF